MGFWSGLRVLWGGAKPDVDPEVERLKAARAARRADHSLGIDHRADLGVARQLASTGRKADALDDLRVELRNAAAQVDQEFSQCTAKEKRSLVAMLRSKVYGVCAVMVADSGDAQLAYGLIAHAWWICGLVTGGDRADEVRAARTQARWAGAALGPAELPASVLAWAVAFKPLRTADDVERFSSELWSLFGLDPKDRLTA